MPFIRVAIILGFSAWAAGYAFPARADCINPIAPAGAIIYNTTHDLFQGCADTTWVSLHGKTVPDCGNIGDICVDGTIYAGLTPDGNKRMFIAAADLAGTYAWDPQGVSSPRPTFSGFAESATGKANTATMDTYAPGDYPAGQACGSAVIHGHSDWYLPAKNEAQVIFNSFKLGRPAPIAGFSSVNYYTSNGNAGGFATYYNMGWASWMNASQGMLATTKVRCARYD